jgi:hypothetical protein
MDELARGTERRVAGVTVSRVRPIRRGSFGFRMAGAALGFAAVLLVVFAATGLILGTTGPRPAATWPLRTDVGRGEWTGLEWHDITATAGGLTGVPYWSMPSIGSGGVVKWSGGYAMIAGDLSVWLSIDGITWTRSSAPPFAPWIVACGHELVVSGDETGTSKPGVWSTEDGITWTPVLLPHGLSGAPGLAASDPGIVAVQTVSAIQSGPSDVYFTSDFETWTHSAVPSDMAAAGNLQVTPFVHGFMAIGEVEDPNGSYTVTDDAGNQTRYSLRAWLSHDGLSWNRYDAKANEPGLSSNVPPWQSMQQGRLGAGDGSIYSSDGGVTWLADHVLVPGRGRLASDGNRIVMAAGSGARFYLSEGDGQWLQLQQGGDVASLQTDGRLVLLPNGVLWITGNRVYFGQALSGVEPRGSVGPPTTASPGPTSAEPTSTPAEVATPESSSGASPAATLTASGFTTSGAVSAWNGFTPTPLRSDSPMLADPDRPGSGVSQVLRWRGGYVATGSVTLFGETSPSLGLWTSPDGVTWTPVTSIGAAAVFVSVAPVGLVAIGTNPSGTDGSAIPVSVWTSADGVTWLDAGPPNLHGRVVSIAGTTTGIVATVDVPTASSAKGSYDTYAVEYSTDGVTWTPESIDAGLATAQPGYGLPPHVQTNDGHFYLMGSPGPATSSTGFELTASVAPGDEMWLSDDGKTWTKSSGGYSMVADFIDFGRDGMLLNTNSTGIPGGTGLALSTDGGKTWHDDTKLIPLGPYACQGECGSGPDGAIGSNGTAFVAVKSGGAKAWLSYDGHNWTSIPWSGGDLAGAGYGGSGGFVVMPRGVLVGGVYAAAR